ncbi:MAG: hypothetical protein UIH27_11885 [Ruminococcus sp.]|nr:hypothetical protein [Ruminococcus sp.]
MATCADCVHVEVCNSRIPDPNNERIICEQFKDRSRFVELPCKVGDTVYVIEKIADEVRVIQDVVETISIGYCADGINIYQFDGIKTDGYFSDFGKTVFLTHEEAEQALKERERNADNKNDT